MKGYIDTDKLKESFIVSGLFDSGELGVILNIVEDQPVLKPSKPINVLTNYDKITNMTFEDLAGFMKDYGCPPDVILRDCKKFEFCRCCWRDYLNQEIDIEPVN